MEGLSDSNYPWPVSNFSDQEDIYPPHLYNGSQTITTANSIINCSVSEFPEALPLWGLSNSHIAFNWPISLQEIYGTPCTDISTCPEEHSLHNLFINAEPSSELNVMLNNVAGEDPNHSILGTTVPSLVTKKKYICPVETCKHKTFTRKADLERHNLTHTGKRPFECRFRGCNRVGKNAFPRRDKLVDHQRKVHKATWDEWRDRHLIASTASSNPEVQDT
jgi:hypothetical protein